MDTVVYEWRREDGSPYYIGIGRPQRPYVGRRSCGSTPPRDRIVILHEGLDWGKACEIERELIAFYGRKDLGTGILRNLTDGGEGANGAVRSEETKVKLSEALSGENNPMYGKNVSEKTRAKISEALSGENHPMYGKTGENHPLYGKKRSEETKAKISGKNNPMYGKTGENHSRYGKTHSEESRAKMSEAKSGKNHPNYGKRASEETRIKLSEANLGENNPMYGKTHAEETKSKMSEGNSGKNNPRYTPRNWYHPVYGEVLQKSSSELIKMFPEQKLGGSSLSAVALGKRSHHKGWIKLKA
jgi:hypothetical protein